eukprot:TRINITY_DN10523_c0_g1_i1.p1 TRINITY_DN10523_c0_g1~~TRINITY_DN10523_c0_g1_i1.p1  ORF type:complete len:404 (+),score=43.41 TRINITY_DN10523_c0_g1_i1:68-1213(+)
MSRRSPRRGSSRRPRRECGAAPPHPAPRAAAEGWPPPPAGGPAAPWPASGPMSRACVLAAACAGRAVSSDRASVSETSLPSQIVAAPQAPALQRAPPPAGTAAPGGADVRIISPRRRREGRGTTPPARGRLTPRAPVDSPPLALRTSTSPRGGGVHAAPSPTSDASGSRHPSRRRRAHSVRRRADLGRRRAERRRRSQPPLRPDVESVAAAGAAAARLALARDQASGVASAGALLSGLHRSDRAAVMRAVAARLAQQGPDFSPPWPSGEAGPHQQLLMGLVQSVSELRQALARPPAPQPPPGAVLAYAFPAAAWPAVQSAPLQQGHAPPGRIEEDRHAIATDAHRRRADAAAAATTASASGWADCGAQQYYAYGSAFHSST